MLIETEKSKGAEKKGAIMIDPLDVKNLEALRRLRGADLPLSDLGLPGPR